MSTKYLIDFNDFIYKNHYGKYYIDQVDYEAINKIKSSDLIIGTSNFLNQVTNVLEQKNLNLEYKICNNGATIWKNDDCLFSSVISHQQIKNFIVNNEKQTSAFVFYTKTSALVFDNSIDIVNQLFTDIKTFTLIKQEQLYEFDDIVSIGCFFTKELVLDNELALHKPFINIDYVDVTNKDVSINTAYCKLSKTEKFDEHKLITFGNAENYFAIGKNSDVHYANFNCSESIKFIKEKTITNIAEIIGDLNKPINNYHIHTFRCGHSNIREELLIQIAIKKGYAEINFAEHLSFPDSKWNEQKIPYNKIDEYLNDLNILKNKYSSQIKINVGFETEFHLEYIEYYKKIKNNQLVDFIALAFHEFVYQEKNIPWSTKQEKIDYDYIIDYYSKALQTNIFDYIVHPDLIFAFNYFTDESKIFTEKFLDLVMEYNIPIEFNSYGIRERGRPSFINNVWIGQPCLPFWDIIQKSNFKNIFFGGDTHQIGEFDGWADEIAYAIFIDFLQDHDLETSFNSNLPYLQTYFSEVKKWNL